MPPDDNRNDNFSTLARILKERAEVLDCLNDLHVDPNLRLTVATFYKDKVLSICQQILAANGFVFAKR